MQRPDLQQNRTTDAGQAARVYFPEILSGFNLRLNEKKGSAPGYWIGRPNERGFLRTQ